MTPLIFFIIAAIIFMISTMLSMNNLVEPLVNIYLLVMGSVFLIGGWFARAMEKKEEREDD